uniref:ATPase family AAA domain containing 5a n=1 Tax=Sinocyclocheilus grahami TaxID=75366 RepID=A0A672KSU3_SINGR
MDYFKRTSPAQEIKSCPLVAKESSPQPSEQVSQEIPGKPIRGQGQKRTRKAKDGKKAKGEDAQVVTDDVVLIESPSESAVNESNTAVLPAQNSDKESDVRKNATEGDPNVLTIKNSAESSEQKSLLKQSRRKDCANRKSAVRRNRKAKVGCEETKECDADAQEPVCETKLEESADKKSSTITISFKDFLQNQSQEQEESNAIPKTDATDTSSEGNLCNDQSDSAVGPLQVSPRTLTIQAEVHPISPDHHESVKVAKELKVASIFSRNKKSQLKEDKSLSHPIPEVKPDVLPDLKRKSNVVLLEEDLELDVVESSPNPKSTETERKQFMNAFKQPSLDGFKSKTNKGQSKQNHVHEKVPEAADKEHEKSLENKTEEKCIEDKTEVTSLEQHEEQQSCPGDKKKRARKSGKNGEAKKAEDAQAATPKPEEPPKEVGNESSPADNYNSEKAVRELRRSTRELSRRQLAAVLNTAPQKKERQEDTVKDDETQNTPSLASTPKAQRPKRGIYRAEMLCPPDMKGSPIRMRITKVFLSSATKAGDFEISSPLSTQELNAVKKRKQARKLVQKAKDVNEHEIPPCHTACTECLLGIRNMQTENIADLLLKHECSVLDSIKCWDLLSEVHRRGGNLLYSNMESLLPLPTRLLPQSTLKSQPRPNPQSHPEQVPQTVRLEVLEEPSDDGSPLKVSSRMRGRKKMGMSNKDVFQSDSESEDDFLSLPKISRAPAQSTISEPANMSVNVCEAASMKPRHVVLSEAERKKSKPVMQCLSSLAEYMDHMSFLDSTLRYQPLQTEGSCRPQDFGWTGAEVKSGMTDDIRLECVSRVNGVNVNEIHAALGHLSFRKCKAVVSEAWDRAQQLEEEIRREAEEELTLPVAPHKDGFSLTQTTPCDPRVMERRSEVMKSVLSSRSAGTLGNQVAAALDYLPSLRTICRSERLKEQGKIKRRFLHYLDGIHFSLPKSTMEFLASEFP